MGLWVGITGEGNVAQKRGRRQGGLALHVTKHEREKLGAGLLFCFFFRFILKNKNYGYALIQASWELSSIMINFRGGICNYSFCQKA